MDLHSTSLLVAASAALTSGCLRFDDASGQEGYCFDDEIGRYRSCLDTSADAGLESDADFDSGAAPVDVGFADTGVHPDAMVADMGFPDSGVHPDAMVVDMGFPDSGVHPDAMLVDMGFADTGVHPDAMPVDMGFADTGVHPDAMVVDMGFPDSGVHADAMVSDAGFVTVNVTVSQFQPRDQVFVPTNQGIYGCGFLSGPPPCTLSVAAFEFLRLTAAPDSWNGGSTFDSWTGAGSGCGVNTTCTLFTSGDLTVGARFVSQ